MSLSDVTVKNLRPKAGDYWRADTDAKGENPHSLYLRVRSTGKKVWVLRRMRDGKLTNITLGRYPALTLAKARKQARDILEGSADPKSVKAVADEWFRLKIAGKYRRPKQVRQYLDRIPTGIAAKLIHDVDRRDVHRELVHYATTRGPVGAARFLAIYKQLFGYAAAAGYVADSPLAQMTARDIGYNEKPRDRTLTDAEVRAIWTADGSHVQLLRFLLLTGQRIGEAQRMTWDHVVGERWTIPKEHSKNKKAHWVALSRQALALLDQQPKDDKLAFGHASNTAVQAWVRRWQGEAGNAWTPHDLRRTMATRMNDLGIAPHVVERILNHSMQGVMAVYNRAEYEKERTEAMQRWADELDRILQGGAP